MADIAADKAELVALFVEALLYGIFVVLFYQSIRILTDKRSSPKINWPLLLTSIAIFATATGHLAIILRRALEAFIEDRDEKGGPVAYYGNLRSALEVSQATFQVAIGMLGDGMAVYRVFAVYNRNYLAIVLPMISFLGTIAASIGSVVVIGQSSSRASAFYFPRLETWMPVFFGLTFCTSVVCTGLIAVRLWYVNRRVANYASGGRKTRRLIAIQRGIIESASLYSAIMFIYLVTYLAKTNYSIIFGDMVSPIIGIVFSLITIRISEAFAAQGVTSVTQTTTPPTPRGPRAGLSPNPITLDIARPAESFSDRDTTGLDSHERFKSPYESMQEVGNEKT